MFEAIAGMLGIVVLVIKNIRSKWFGDTDLKAERLERILHALGRAMIFMDEADVMLGGVGAGYRLTGARLAEAGEDVGGTVELVPPGGILPTSPRTRANVALPPIIGGPGDTIYQAEIAAAQAFVRACDPRYTRAAVISFQVKLYEADGLLRSHDPALRGVPTPVGGGVRRHPQHPALARPPGVLRKVEDPRRAEDEGRVGLAAHLLRRGQR
jgi:hypothetical protein